MPRRPFERGSVDAWAIWDPFLALIEAELPTRTICDATGLSHYHRYYTAATSFAEAHSDLVTIVYDALVAKGAWVKQNPAQAAKTLSPIWGGMPTAVIERANNRRTYHVEPVEKAQLGDQQLIADTFAAAHLIPKPINATNVTNLASGGEPDMTAGLQPTEANAEQRARDLAVVFARTAAEHDRTGAFPFSNFRLLHEAGLLALRTPTRLGGGGWRGRQSRPRHRHDRAGRAGHRAGAGDAVTSSMPASARSAHWPEHLKARVAREAVTGISLINALRVEPELGSPARGGLPGTMAVRRNDGWHPLRPQDLLDGIADPGLVRRLGAHRRGSSRVSALSWCRQACRARSSRRLGNHLGPARQRQPRHGFRRRRDPARPCSRHPPAGSMDAGGTRCRDTSRTASYWRRSTTASRGRRRHG